VFTLYVVATPIGNLEDISLRALRVLRTVKLIAAEDTRKTKILLNAYDIKTPLTAYHEHNKYARLDYLLTFLAAGGDLALVSEAGTPGISDPGHELIMAAGQKGVPVVAIPGPSVVVMAVAVSGLPTDRFTYLGFLPRRPVMRRQLLGRLKEESGTLVVFEAPHRLGATLADLETTLGDRRIAVCREMTKIHEEIFRGRISEAASRFTEPRGEFTLVIEGQTAAARPEMTPDTKRRLRELRRAGTTAREAISRVSGETGLSRKELYRAWLSLRT
jgi:16S rRNA (cytidine1402-2'-O)-methyltransferase